MSEENNAPNSQMDPWLMNDKQESTSGHFEDEFKPFQPLPDSDAYLASLESKLNRLKKGRKGEESKEVLKCIRLMKDDLMKNLINSNFECEGEVSEELTHNRLYQVLERNLFPERQALTREELLRLLDDDVLSEKGRE